MVRFCSILTALLTLWMVAGPGAALAQDLDRFDLEPEEVQTLNAEALEHYREGQRQLDRIDYERAIAAYAQAAKADDDHVPIRFVLAKLALQEGRKAIEDEALENLRIAENAYTEVLTMGLTEEEGKRPLRSQMDRAREGLKIVQQRILEQDRRDAQRYKVGSAIVKHQAEEFYGDQE